MADLETLIRLQEHDTRIARLEAEAARLPRQIEALQEALAKARTAVDAVKARIETAKKDLRGREQDLDDVGVKRSKSEARLWEVKTNEEYSAVLREIEEIKRTKARIEEEILSFMELQERAGLDLREAERTFREREEQARQDEAAVRQKLAAVEAELEDVRRERVLTAGELHGRLLTDYERILRARAGLAIVPVINGGVCGGCRVAIRPQALQELRSGTELMICESCGRFLYWSD